MNIANTVISPDNSSLSSMGTDQMLNLFSLDETKKGETSGTKKKESASSEKSTMKDVMNNLEELWDEKQYEAEYDLSNFMKSLAK